jgi:hypothetical protein
MSCPISSVVGRVSSGSILKGDPASSALLGMDAYNIAMGLGSQMGEKAQMPRFAFEIQRCSYRIMREFPVSLSRPCPRLGRSLG